MELKTRRRTKGETLQSLFLDIKRLMALAYPGQTGSIIETTAIDAFVDAFQDRILRKEVLQRSPETLVQALVCAVRMEAINDSGIPEPLPTHDREGHRKERAFAHVERNLPVR